MAKQIKYGVDARKALDSKIKQQKAGQQKACTDIQKICSDIHNQE